jgi:hypothetical protein
VYRDNHGPKEHAANIPETIERGNADARERNLLLLDLLVLVDQPAERGVN